VKHSPELSAMASQAAQTITAAGTQGYNNLKEIAGKALQSQNIAQNSTRT